VSAAGEAATADGLRVAALYDVHGNLPALRSVLEAVGEAEADLVVVGGDVVPGPMPVACLEALLELELPVRFIVGNGERDVLTAARGEEPTRVPEAFRDVVRWTAGALPEAHLAEIRSWPRTLTVEGIVRGDVLFCHATPRSDDELFTRRTPEERIRPVFEPTGASIVVCGHTHMQFDRRVGTARVVNAGSVGMPFGEPGAYWALVGAEVELRRTGFDLEAAADAIAATACPGAERFDPRNPPSEDAMLEAFEAAALDARARD